MPPERLHSFDLPIQRILVDCETRLPPWMKLVAQSDETAFVRLSNEIIALAELISPTAKERRVRKDIINRLQLQVRRIWPEATVVPIGSYAQDLYTSSSDMDLFVSISEIPYSLEHLELLYNALESTFLAVPGTLSIVRGARVPIIKYVDAHGSGIQVDVSMNNVSATSSTKFVQHHLSISLVLRPLTMVLKQWLFQRKMNEVYLRGGLSSYALFLLVLTTVHQNNLESLYPPDEAAGRYLLQFLRQWGAPTAFAEVIRPLHGFLNKSVLNWDDLYHPFSLCIPPSDWSNKGIQDPVNENNCIGRQTFSIREIQQEWQLSFNALTVAIKEYEMDINGGRERSLLASIVGLTTREYECRKQINGLYLGGTSPDTTPPKIRMSTSTVCMHNSPPLELNPVPTKRIKFRDTLTRNGGLIENEERNRITAEKDELERSFELLDLSGGDEFETRLASTSNGSNRISEQFDFNEFVTITNTNTDPHHNELADSNVPPDPATGLSTINNLRYTDSTPPVPTAYPLDIETAPSPVPSTPSVHSVSTAPTPPTVRSLGGSPHLEFALNVEPAGPDIVSTLSSHEPDNERTSLLDIDVNFNSSPPGALEDLAGLNMHSQPQSLDDLMGLDFQKSEPPATFVGPNVSRQEESTSEDLFREAIVFQDRRSRRQLRDSKPKQPIDPDLADRAFRMFSQGIRSHKS